MVSGLKKILIILFVIASQSAHSAPDGEQTFELRNYLTLAKTYGYIRYFHPTTALKSWLGIIFFRKV